MKLENGAWYLQDAAREMVRYHPELVRRVGVAYLNVAGKYTPPNRGRFSRVEKGSGYGSKNVKALQKRIITEIIGGGGSLSPLPTAIPTAEGRGVHWQGPAWSYGGYAFRVPRNAGKRPVRYVNPETVLAKRQFRRKGDVVRARAGRVPDSINWVRPADLRAAIKRRTDHAGSIIAAWYPSAQLLNASNAARDFNVSKFPRYGRAYFSRTSLFFHELHLETSWHGIVGRFVPYFETKVQRAAEFAVRNTENWFLKQIFG